MNMLDINPDYARMDQYQKYQSSLDEVEAEVTKCTYCREEFDKDEAHYFMGDTICPKCYPFNF